MDRFDKIFNNLLVWLFFKDSFMEKEVLVILKMKVVKKEKKEEILLEV